MEFTKQELKILKTALSNQYELENEYKSTGYILAPKVWDLLERITKEMEKE